VPDPSGLAFSWLRDRMVRASGFGTENPRPARYPEPSRQLFLEGFDCLGQGGRELYRHVLDLPFVHVGPDILVGLHPGLHVSMARCSQTSWIFSLTPPGEAVMAGSGLCCILQVPGRQ